MLGNNMRSRMINIQILEEIGEEWHKLKGKTDIPIKY
jgi:hypothetical protein